MEETIVVSVSPFYSGRGWTDAKTGIDFAPKESLRAVRISKNKDLSGIRNSLRLNNLLLLEGTLDTDGEANLDDVNPEELTKAQFNTLVSGLKKGDTQANNAKEIDQLKKENAELKAQKEALEDQLKAMQTETEVVEEAEKIEDLPSKSQLEGMTNAKLKTLMDEQGIAYDSSDTKKDLVGKILGDQ